MCCWKANISNILTSKPSRILRKKGKTSESINPPLNNHIKLTYNILKNLKDNIISEKEIPELDQYSECNNGILTCMTSEGNYYPYL
jgi:hypothetical protein